MAEREPDGPGSSGRWRAGSLALFVALAVLHTWPLATSPGTLSRNDNSDTILHEWILAWVAHQVVTDPLRLFHANIFYPEPYTLAYSDHLFIQAMMVAPVLWLGGSPVLAYNLAVMAGLALTGWTTSLVIAAWTNSRLAGVLAGSLVAFNAFTLTRLTQVQDLHLQFFLPALLALDRLLAMPRLRHALQLAGWSVLQGLTGAYLSVFTAITLVAAIAARPGEWTGRRFRPVAPLLGLAGIVAIVALLPFLLPYYYVSRDAGLVRPLADVRQYSAQLTDYLATGGRVHFEGWSRPFFAGDALFPGVTALALGTVAIGARVAFHDPRARMALAFGGVAFALSFGPAFPPYRWLYDVFPPLTGIRGAVRFGQIVLAAAGVLAAFGLAVILRRIRPGWSLAAGLLCIATANLEALRAPMGYTAYRGIAPIYDGLPELGRDAVLVYVPFPPREHPQLNAPFMLMTTRSWQRTLNGYSGFRPASYARHAEALAGFPDARSVAYLLEQGATHVLADGRKMTPEQLGRLGDFPALQVVATDGNLRIFRLERD
jgi:hypothetical protein